MTNKIEVLEETMVFLDLSTAEFTTNEYECCLKEIAWEIQARLNKLSIRPGKKYYEC